MGRKTETLKLENDTIEVTTMQLGYEDAEDLLPDIIQIVASVMEIAAPLFAAGGVDMESDVAKLAPILPAIASQISGGKLKKLVQPLLKTTRVVMPDPANPSEKIQLELIKKDERATLFEEYPQHYFPIIFFAGKVTFARFFPASARRAKPAATTATE